MEKLKIVSLILCLALLLSPASLAAEGAKTQRIDEPDYFTLTSIEPVGEEFEVTPEMLREKELSRKAPRAEWPELPVFQVEGEFSFNVEILETYRLEGDSGDGDLDSGAEELDSGRKDFRAGVPDLTVNTLRASVAQPLPVRVETEFTVRVENSGAGTVTNPAVAIYFDNKLQGTATVGATLSGGQGVVFGITGLTTVAGNHTIKVHINPNSTIAESNYGNNVVSQSFAWSEWPNLSAYEIVYLGVTNNPIDENIMGNHYFESMQLAYFRFSVVNLGPAQATNVLVEVYMIDDRGNRAKVGSVKIPQLNSGTGRYLDMNGFFSRSMDLEVELQVDPANTCRDFYRGNNRISEFYLVEPEFDKNLKCKWADPSSLSVIMFDSAANFLANNNVSVARTQAKMQEWNGVADAVGFTNIVRAANPDAGNFDSYKITIIAESGAPEHSATTVFMTRDGAGNLTFIDPYHDRSMLGRATIRYHDGFVTNNQRFKEWVILHEAGHALGLDHPYRHDDEEEAPYACYDPSVMRYPDEGTNMHSYSITWHDEVQVDKIYN